MEKSFPSVVAHNNTFCAEQSDGKTNRWSRDVLHPGRVQYLYVYTYMYDEHESGHYSYYIHETASLQRPVQLTFREIV